MAHKPSAKYCNTKAAGTQGRDAIALQTRSAAAPGGAALLQPPCPPSKSVLPRNMADKCTKKGWCCCSILLFFIACIVGGFIFGGMSNPNGELETWFAVEGCWSENASITVAGRGAFDAYLMRPARGYQVGSACPTDTSGFAAFGYNEMVLEKTNGESDSEEDGGTPLGDDFRLGGEYSPLFLLPSDSYATMSIEILDSTGAIIYPTAIFSLGKDEGYPWQAP